MKKTNYGAIYNLSAPECVGIIPTRSDIEILPTDSSSQIKLGWKVMETRSNVDPDFCPIFGELYNKINKIYKNKDYNNRLLTIFIHDIYFGDKSLSIFSKKKYLCYHE